MSSSKRPFGSTRGRATLLFMSSCVVVLVYLMLARPRGTGVAVGVGMGVGTQNGGSSERVQASGGSAGGSAGGSTVGPSSTSAGALSALSNFLGGHTLLTGSVTDKIFENPQESLAALIEEQKRLNTEGSTSGCAEVPVERVDPLPGNLTDRFHGSCRSQFPPTVPNVQVRQIWKSPNMRKATDVTLVTHLTLDHLPKLEFQCEKWRGRLAAAIYVPLPYPKSEAARGDNEAFEDPNERPDDALVHATLVAAEREVGTFFDKIHSQGLPCTLVRH